MNDVTIGSITFGPATKQPPNTYQLLDEKAQAELAYLKAIHEHFVEYLAAKYKDGRAVEIAGLCDETLDRSGRLLGRVREAAARK